MRLRAIDGAGHRTLFMQVRREINDVLDKAELELHNKQLLQQQQQQQQQLHR